MTPQEAQERSADAGEYVLGTLAADARAAFESAALANPALRAEVYFWQDRLLGLTRRVAPDTPDASLWPGIQARLGLAPARAVPLPATAATAVPEAFWQRLRRWQWASGLALACALVLASVLALRTLAPPATPARYLALLQSSDKTTGWVVEITQGGQVRLVPVAGPTPVPAGKALQFWTKAEGAAGPTSLGLVPGGRTTELSAALLPALGERQLFELTLEPEGGSTIGRPTGPVLFLGRSVRL